MFDRQGRYVIRDYQTKPPFSSFLPGIAGPLGVPVWCYYNNRGQAVCSFGAKDKDHAIMEFSPAHTAYQNVSRTGFRTFCKINGAYRELFTRNCDMHIGMSEVEITCREGGLEASALYFGVPGERTAALARVLTVRNTGEAPAALELLDGMPAIVPYGVDQDALKNMANLAKAWMQAEDVDAGRACFRVRASMADTAQVTKVKGCNFCLGLDGAGTLLRPLVQPELVFGQDTSLERPEGFVSTSLKKLTALPQMTENRFPCCFLPMEAVLEPGEEIALFSLYGQAEDKGRAASLAGRVNGRDWFETKRREAKALVDSLCAPIAARTGDPVFDAYCRQSYLDNLLRGGAPVFFESEGKKRPSISTPGSTATRSGSIITSPLAASTMPRETGISGMSTRTAGAASCLPPIWARRTSTPFLISSNRTAIIRWWSLPAPIRFLMRPWADFWRSCRRTAAPRPRRSWQSPSHPARWLWRWRTGDWAQMRKR